MIDKVIFNWKRYDKNIKDVRAGTRMNTNVLRDIPKSTDTLKTRCQCFDSGFRVNNETLNYKYWNNVIYEDIDYKKYIATHDTYIDAKSLQQHITQYLLTKYKTVFLFSELSRSGTSFHFYFYFDVERNENNWRYCKSLCDAIIKHTFNVLGYDNILKYNGVFDDCTDSPVQMCYMTKHNMITNPSCSGNMKLIRTDNLDIVVRNKNKTQSHIATNINAKFTYTKNDDEYCNDYLDHFERWQLFNSLSRLYHDDELRNEWTRCAMMIPAQNGHDNDFYMREPYVNDWYTRLDGNEYIDVDLLKKYGYHVQFQHKQNKKFMINDDFIKIFID